MLGFHCSISQLVIMGDLTQSHIIIGRKARHLTSLHKILGSKPRDCKNCALGVRSNKVCFEHITCCNICSTFILSFRNFWYENTWTHNHKTVTTVNSPVLQQCTKVRKIKKKIVFYVVPSIKKIVIN